jgi:hypothetical protein
MGVINAQLMSTGFVPTTAGNTTSPAQQLPTISLIETDNTLAQVLVTGYLNTTVFNFAQAYNNNQMALVYTSNFGPVWLKIVVAGGNTSLAFPAGSEISGLTFTGALTVGDLLKVNNVTGILEDTGVLASNLVLLNAANQIAANGAIYLNKGTGTTVGDAVIINTQAGTITAAVTTAAQGTTAITLTNNKIASTRLVNCFLVGGTNTTIGVQLSAVAGSGSAIITVSNGHDTDALNGNLLIGFQVL